MTEKIVKSEAEWQAQLTPLQYAVMRQHGTERAFTGEYVNTKEDGTYHCAGCDQPLFSSGTKFDSGSGWPSFWDVLDRGNVELREDNSYGMQRVEVLCNRCGSHLGHVFPDGPRDTTGLRFCINSVALSLKPEDSHQS